MKIITNNQAVYDVLKAQAGGAMEIVFDESYITTIVELVDEDINFITEMVQSKKGKLLINSIKYLV